MHTFDKSEKLDRLTDLDAVTAQMYFADRPEFFSDDQKQAVAGASEAEAASAEAPGAEAEG